MKKSLELKLLALTIEWHWWFIMRGRKKCKKMIEEGTPFTSPNLIRLDNKIASRGLLAFNASRRYEELSGIRTASDAMQQIPASVA